MSIALPRKLNPVDMILKPRLSQLIYLCPYPHLEWAGLERMWVVLEPKVGRANQNKLNLV